MASGLRALHHDPEVAIDGGDDGDDDSRFEAPKPSPSDLKRRTNRLMVECRVPARRYEMMVCVCFWIVVGAICAGVAMLVLLPRGAADAQPQVESGTLNEVQRRCHAPQCTVPHLAGTHRDGDDRACPPGHAWSSLDTARIWSTGSRGMCLRRHFYPRVFDASLVDTATPVCRDPYQHACGAWNAWFSHPHPLVPLDDPAQYHANILPVLDASLHDRESMLYRFVNTQCRPLVTVAGLPVRDDPALWLQTQQGAQLPVWIEPLGVHSLCLLAAIDALVPEWFYADALDITVVKARSLSTRVREAARTHCPQNATHTWLGALGDPFIAQVEWTAPPPSDHAAQHLLLGSVYGHLWSMASALAPYSWLAIGRGRAVQLRVALPRDRAEWMRPSHCERIASVMFVEALEDRYTAAVRRQRPDAVLAALSNCEAVAPRVRISMLERPQQVRSDVWKCIERQQASNWHQLAAVAAACNAGHRVQFDTPLGDAFVPSVVVVDDTAIHVTPALLQTPWFSDEMELPSVAARLYWTLLAPVAKQRMQRGVDDCRVQQQRDEWVLGAMTQCFRQLMDAQFWLELVQLHCGTTNDHCPRRWSNLLQNSAAFRRAHKCGQAPR